MTFITSKRFVLPDTPEGLTNGLWFNMWARKFWPYNELEPGAVLFWYETPNRCIVWRSKVVDVIRFPYGRKKEVEDKLQMTVVQVAHPYFVDAPDLGFCLSYKVKALERISIAKPDDFQFPQLGWLRVDSALRGKWPGLAPSV
jgi:hypothetical protein